MNWHPHAEDYPMIDGEAYDNFSQSIGPEGPINSVKFRMVKGKRQYLDGRNRVRVCEERGLPFAEEEVFVSDADVKAYIDRCNLHRRHLSPEQRQYHAQSMRANGASTKEIAATLKTTPRTVRRDLEEDKEESEKSPRRTNVPSGKIPDRIKAEDGKTYPAKRPVMRCARCTRMWPDSDQSTPDCKGCAALQGKPKEPPASKPPQPAATPAPTGACKDKIKSTCPHCGKEGVFTHGHAKIPLVFTLEQGSPEFQAAWDEWMGYRRERHLTMTAKTLQKQLDFLDSLGPEAAIESIKNSIRNGWIGLFHPKQGKEKNEPVNNYEGFGLGPDPWQADPE